jgi:tetratricopeptide (TPR) repeat protein
MWFERLAAAKDQTEGRTAEGHIQQIWLQSGSDTVDLLMAWALDALNEKDYALTLDLLDSVTIMKPDFAEGWNKRATVHFMMDRYAESLADIERTLALEPRHFGAISGLGLILREMDQNAPALEMLKRALDINPYLEGIADIVAELEKKVGGNI